ncbi:MAG: cobaltochelatase subunit CobT, partial [Proteobacteria bacterium]|nr:cobaltochelatase subunit CobT [Pseudomonadota bacterium]
MREGESRAARFRRAVEAATAAIAERGVTLGFTKTGKAAAHGTRLTVPEPGADLRPSSVAQARGAADSAALWLRYHDTTAHAALAPGAEEAAAAFEACERARVEALGAKQMAGVAANLDSYLGADITGEGIAHPRSRDEVPLPWALRLLVQERVTRRPLPAPARNLAALWRPVIEGRAGRSLDAMVAAAGDQQSFGLAARQLLADLGLPLADGDGNEAEPEARNDEDSDGGDEG